MRNSRNAHNKSQATNKYGMNGLALRMRKFDAYKMSGFSWYKSPEYGFTLFSYRNAPSWTEKMEKNGSNPLELKAKFCIDQILLRFHELSGVVTSTRLRTVSAKFDVIKKQRTMPAKPKLNTRFCDIFIVDLLLFLFLMAHFSFIQLWFCAVNSLYHWLNCLSPLWKYR